jgi:hypothetical protein
LALFPRGAISRQLLHRRGVARGALDLLVRSFAIQASGTVNTNTMLVLEVDDFSCGGSPGLVLRELVYDCGDPAVLAHRRALVMEVIFRAMNEFSRGIVTHSLDA